VPLENAYSLKRVFYLKFAYLASFIKFRIDQLKFSHFHSIPSFFSILKLSIIMDTLHIGTSIVPAFIRSQIPVENPHPTILTLYMTTLVDFLRPQSEKVKKERGNRIKRLTPPAARHLKHSIYSAHHQKFHEITTLFSTIRTCTECIKAVCFFPPVIATVSRSRISILLSRNGHSA
jgi:hypothetical protein